MNLEKYTQKSQEALLGAQRLAEELNHQTIEPAHLLLALLSQEDGVVPAIVTKVAGSVLAIRDELQKELENQPKVYGGRHSGRFIARCSRYLEICREICQRNEG